jgi:hypothetical protein
MSPESRPWPTSPIPSVRWMGEEGAPPLGAALRLRPVRDAGTTHVFGGRGGVYIGIGADGRPTSVMTFSGLSARAALHVLRLLAEGTTSASPGGIGKGASEPEPGFAPLDASPALWAWLCAALGDVCARLPAVDDEWLGLPTAAA